VEGKYDEGGAHSKLIEGVTITNKQGYLGFTKNDRGRFYFKDDFLQQFNHTINDMKKQGEIKKIALNSIQQE